MITFSVHFKGGWDRDSCARVSLAWRLVEEEGVGGSAFHEVVEEILGKALDKLPVPAVCKVGQIDVVMRLLSDKRKRSQHQDRINKQEREREFKREREESSRERERDQNLGNDNLGCLCQDGLQLREKLLSFFISEITFLVVHPLSQIQDLLDLW